MKYEKDGGEVVRAVAADRRGVGFLNFAAELPGDLTKAGVKVLAIGRVGGADHAALPGDGGMRRGNTR